MKTILLLAALLLTGAAISGTGRKPAVGKSQFEKKNLHRNEGRIPHMPRPVLFIRK